MSERPASILDRKTLIPVGSAFALACGLFWAGGIYADWKSHEKLDVPAKFEAIQGKINAVALDVALIKGRLGITTSDHRAGIDPTSSLSETTPPQLQLPPTWRQHKAGFAE